MTGTLVTSTPKADFHSLAFQGIMAYSCFPQIRDMLQRKFGDEYFLIFAKPVENPENGVIDWYTPVQGQPAPLAKSPPEKQQAILAQIQSMGQAIHTYAEELSHSPDPFKVTRGNILKLILMYPDLNCIYLVGNQPVIVCWGFGKGTEGVKPQNLTSIAATARPMPEPAAPEPEVASAVIPEPQSSPRPARAPLYWGWLWWLLPLLALCLLILLCFTAFGPIPPLAGKTLFYAPDPLFLSKPEDKSPQLAALDREIAELQARLQDHAAMCKPESASTPQPEVSPEQQLIIPPKADDTSFLQGKWLCDTGLANTRTREPVQLEFSFGANGRGSGVVYEKDDICSGAAQADMRNGELHIELGGQICKKHGGGYLPVTIICTSASGATTECHGLNSDGSPWKATFRRIQ